MQEIRPIAGHDEHELGHEREPLLHVENHQYERCGAQDERRPRHVRIAGRAVFEFAGGMAGLQPTATEHDLAVGDGDPHHHGGQAGKRHQHQVHSRGGDHGRQERQQATGHRGAQGEHRHAATVRFGEPARNHAFVAHRPHHARGGVQAGIRGGEHGREHHEVHDVSRIGDAYAVEHEHERAFAHAGLAPRDQRAHHGD